MPVHNNEIANSFEQLADLLEVDSANPFRVRAYRNAARTIRGLPDPVFKMVEAGEDLSKLAGIGDDLAGKIEGIVRDGRFRLLEEVKANVPQGLSDVVALPGLGPKRTAQLWSKLGIEGIEDLAKAAEAGKVRALGGFGEKTERKIISAIQRNHGKERRFLRADLEEIVCSLVEHLRGISGVEKVVAAGSYRRKRATMGDLDILVTCKRGTPVVDRFVEYDEVEEVISKGRTKAAVRLRSDLQVDLRVVRQVSYGAALFYFTGSKSHNIAVRKIAAGKGLKINEYGVFRGDRRVSGKTEEKVYDAIGLPFIAPELREDEGEIAAARNGELPTLLELGDIRGNLHTHTTASDGKHSLREMAEAAKEIGYGYLGITDHSKQVRVAKGLDEKRLRCQMEEIDKLNGELDGIRILKGIEVDILEDGSLDLTDEILADLDIVVASIHSHFELSREKQTQRVLRAMENPHLNILGHPTGRLINKREPYEIDMEKFMRAALDHGCFPELNAQPERLDLHHWHCRMAKEMGLRVVISTDAHSTGDLKLMRYGVDEARRGWLEADDVLNTRSWSDLKTLLKRK